MANRKDVLSRIEKRSNAFFSIEDLDSEIIRVNERRQVLYREKLRRSKPIRKSLLIIKMNSLFFIGFLFLISLAVRLGN